MRFRLVKKVTVEYLNKFVPEEYRAENFAYKSDLRLEDAKKKYRVVSAACRGETSEEYMDL